MTKEERCGLYFFWVSLLVALILVGVAQWQKHQPNDRWCDLGAMGAVTVYSAPQQTIMGNGEMLVRNGVRVAQEADSLQNVEIDFEGKLIYADKENEYVVCAFDGAIREGELNFIENPYATITYKKITIYQRFRWDEVAQ